MKIIPIEFPLEQKYDGIGTSAHHEMWLRSLLFGMSHDMKTIYVEHSNGELRTRPNYNGDGNIEEIWFPRFEFDIPRELLSKYLILGWIVTTDKNALYQAEFYSRIKFPKMHFNTYWQHFEYGMRYTKHTAAPYERILNILKPGTTIPEYMPQTRQDYE